MLNCEQRSLTRSPNRKHTKAPLAATKWPMNKGGSFQKNCGAASEKNPRSQIEGLFCSTSTIILKLHNIIATELMSSLTSVNFTESRSAAKRTLSRHHKAWLMSPLTEEILKGSLHSPCVLLVPNNPTGFKIF